MEHVVVDSSIAVKWFLDEPFSSASRIIRLNAKEGRCLLYAPDLIYAEVGNIIWKKQRFGDLEDSEAQTIITDFRALTLRITPSVDLLAEAYQIAVTYQRSVYDSLYLALSVRRSCWFVTADEKLVNALGGVLPRVVWIGHWE